MTPKVVNIVEYEFILYTICTVADMVLGTFVHVAVKKDSNSSDARYGALKKLVILLFMGFALGVYDLDKFVMLNQSSQALPLVSEIKAAIIAIFGYMCYFEFVSVAANFAIITGVDMTKIPGVASEIEVKKEEK